MDKLIVEGGLPLKGRVRASGAKNAALPILAAALLGDTPSTIEGVPDLRDVRTMVEILKALGAKVEMDQGQVTIDPSSVKESTAPYELVKTMRASFCVLGPLLAKLGWARVSMPGGCVIGFRPVDLHIKGLSELGADIKIEHGYVVARARRLVGARIYLGGRFGSSVLATANVLMAAVKAEGVTVLENAACEPEVRDLAEFLIRMGARIQGHGTPIMTIEGVKSLKGASHRVIPDRIEAGTYLIAGAITRGDVCVEGVRLGDLGAVFDKLKQIGVALEEGVDWVRVTHFPKIYPTEVTTLAFPGFPTDLQAQMTALLCLADGISVITEKIYPDRFMHLSELSRMGADIREEGNSAIIRGVHHLSGAPVMASDLRASAALILAGLVAEGQTEILRIYHLERGYEKVEEKLAALGANIWREKDTSFTATAAPNSQSSGLSNEEAMKQQDQEK